ncbi:NmrA family NAD(P)-binding protein [Lentzea cavernae]|uniref:NmrA-like domain-containing protein n=1 Tax=Lentzea cavernae TaxID=2020703 RepID=A0ABQ3MHI4_9PSEU|nr:NmrA family NAD(P)-binding protein [Lentzea cavernae]GHH43935.1 hypothetical protein GCM10017774_42460 [Lentzea cavernae]
MNVPALVLGAILGAVIGAPLRALVRPHIAWLEKRSRRTWKVDPLIQHCECVLHAPNIAVGYIGTLVTACMMVLSKVACGVERRMLVVTGPSGNVGAELTDLLCSRTMGSWRVASRRPELMADRVAASGGQSVRFDFFDSSTWSAALEGIRELFLLFPLPGNKAARTAILPFLQAAEKAGCRHVVYVSVFGADKAGFIPHHKIEQALFKSSMTWTVLRCSFFMQNLFRSISTHGEDIARRGELFIPAGNGRTTFIDARDAAAVAVEALLHPGRHHNTVHHLTGPAALTMNEVAESLSVHLGSAVSYTKPSLPRFAGRLRRRGVGWDSIGFMSAVYSLTRLGLNQPITGDVERLLGRPPRTLDDFLADQSWRFAGRSWT